MKAKASLKAYVDLTRLHFFFVWPTLFCAGLFLALHVYGGFSYLLVVQAVLIAFLGFEAGLVLNDIVDVEYDKKDVDANKLTKYWRPFGERPVAQGLITRQKAVLVFGLLVAATSALIFTLPFPNAFYVFGIMITCYCLECFYQVKKRNESFPIAQLIGRVDFTLFLVAGYLCVGKPDLNAVLLFLFFYPLAQAHLGVNDLVDVANDEARKMNTISTMYGLSGTSFWVAGFSGAQFAMAAVFLLAFGSYLLLGGFSVSVLLLSVGTYRVLKGRDSMSALKALPMFHVAMLIYAVSIILAFALAMFL
ncbi:MAG: UbiA family prenyltransferase [Candidatus Bathyarchaeota archaeon]|nr:UbiA family prenyltransferase [Candidatus Bathyarchaeota archaeon]